MPESIGKTTATRRRFMVAVTQEDIDAATKNSSQHCAVATGISQSVTGAYRVLVDIQTIRFSLPEEKMRYVYLTPKAVQDYIIAFDAGDPIKPFNFQLNRLGWYGPTLEGYSRNREKTNIDYKAIMYEPREADEGRHVDRVKEVPVAKGGHGDGPPRSIRDREFGVRRMRRNQTGRKVEE